MLPTAALVAAPAPAPVAVWAETCEVASSDATNKEESLRLFMMAPKGIYKNVIILTKEKRFRANKPNEIN
jgi:hypothetical protein